MHRHLGNNEIFQAANWIWQSTSRATQVHILSQLIAGKWNKKYEIETEKKSEKELRKSATPESKRGARVREGGLVRVTGFYVFPWN